MSKSLVLAVMFICGLSCGSEDDGGAMPGYSGSRLKPYMLQADDGSLIQDGWYDDLFKYKCLSISQGWCEGSSTMSDSFQDPACTQPVTTIDTIVVEHVPPYKIYTRTGPAFAIYWRDRTGYCHDAGMAYRAKEAGTAVTLTKPSDIYN